LLDVVVGVVVPDVLLDAGRRRTSQVHKLRRETSFMISTSRLTVSRPGIVPPSLGTTAVTRWAWSDQQIIGVFSETARMTSCPRQRTHAGTGTGKMALFLDPAFLTRRVRLKRTML